MAESIHDRLKRVRAPRVNIEYKVELGDAIEMRQLPFVMGIFGDFTGQPEEPLERLKDRKFTEVNPDNFDEVLASMKPHLQYSVDNKLSDDPEAGKLSVDLRFRELDDFDPDRVAEQIPALRKLLELRQELADVRGSLQGNEKLEEILQATLSDEDSLAKLKDEIGTGEDE
ncbi:MAG: type VI secretion system contractile sheath small subunit [Gemmatimonadetes bacterium]|nr:type VI secretion system contractile sheath small subunit [Gemmatimonadota bacterium]NNF37161.1 type VI secretion system contractile sheath small subunit [Gemmatimonadota bacterium]